MKSETPQTSRLAGHLPRRACRAAVAIALGLGATGCAAKQTRIWIEPPAGYRAGASQSKKLFYQVEDVQSGKKENLTIPIEQTPDNLVVENHKPASPGAQADFASATQADLQIRNGKLPEATASPKAPTVSYLLGMEEVESLYQQRKYTDALVRITPLLEQYPEQARLYVMQGTLFRKIGEKKMAYQAYRQAHKLERGNPEIEEAMLRLQDELPNTPATEKQ